MPEDTCAPRIASLSEQAKALERRASELATQQDDEQPERVSAADLDALRSDLHAMLNDSHPKRVKDVLQAMIDGIRVDHAIRSNRPFAYPRFALRRVTWAKLLGAQNALGCRHQPFRCPECMSRSVSSQGDRMVAGCHE